MQLALVADWLTTYGGAEHAIREFSAIWPQSPIFTSVARPGRRGFLTGKDIRVTPLQRLYRVLGKHQPLLPLMPKAMEGIDLRGYDAILSSSHAVGKGIIPSAMAVHVCYCHTPMRYAWEMEEQYLEDFRVPRIMRGAARDLLKNLRRWDLSTARRVDRFIANSSETQGRIARIYGRDSLVVSPPVDDRFFATPLAPPDGRTSFLAIGRLVPYKRFDLLIETANALQIQLMVAGRGQEEGKLRRLAGPTVRFLGFVPDERLPGLYAQARALLFAAHEDAGIVPLEAQASGTPVIAYGRGGALDTVTEGKTGLFFADQTIASLTDALKRFEPMAFDPAVIRTHARQFSAPHFRMRVKEIVEETYGTKF